MSDLVQRLSQDQHAVEITLRPTRTVEALKQCLDRGFVHIRFTETRGGTELGIPIDRDRTDLTQADFAAGTGRLRLVGAVTLDYVPVRCIADIELPDLCGRGHLELVVEPIET